MCKYWLENNQVCRFGENCHYAHGEEELAESDRIVEMQARLNDSYKTQNCSQFHKEKICFYGKRCIFRHEHKKWQKLHRHFYIAHLDTIQYTYHEIFDQAQNDIEDCSVCEATTPTTVSEASDEEYESGSQDFITSKI